MNSTAPAATEPNVNPSGRKRNLLFIALLIVLSLGLFLYWYLDASHYESTDDAFIENHPIPVSFRVPGFVFTVHVDDNQSVNQGDLLVELDPRDYQTSVSRAKASLALARAQQMKTGKDLLRYQRLRATGDISAQTLDDARASDEEAQARIAEALASLTQAELNLSYSKIFAVEKGKITEKTIAAGTYVQAGQTLFNLVKPEVWVVANFKETQIAHMRPGQKVDIHVDAYPDKTFQGHVQSIQAGSGAAFSLFPPENATGNYVKVVQRVPVKIVFDENWDHAHPIGPGMSVEPRVKIK